MEDTVTPKELAAEFRCHPDTVRRLIRNGKLAAYRVGGQWRIKAEDVEKLKREVAA
jgi:excisionase family DNA binding protein